MISLKWNSEELEILNKFSEELNSITDWDSAIDVFANIKEKIRKIPGLFEWPQNFYRIALVFFYYKYGPGNMDLIFIRMAERRVGVRICVYGGNNVQLTIYQFYRDLLDNYNFSKAPFPSLQLKKDVRDLVLLEVATDNIYVKDIYELTDELLAIVARANYKYI